MKKGTRGTKAPVLPKHWPLKIITLGLPSLVRTLGKKNQIHNFKVLHVGNLCRKKDENN
jgi:hypothetical protein